MEPLELLHDLRGGVMNALLKKGGGSPPELPSLDQRKRASHHGEGNLQGIVSRGDRCSTQAVQRRGIGG